MENFTPQESLALISQVIQDAKKRFEEDGAVYMFWGLLSTLTALAQFFLMRGDWAHLHFVPYFIMPFGSVFTWYYYKDKPRSSNLVVKTLNVVWYSISINIFALSFVFSSTLGANLIPLILVLLGIGLLVSGFSVASASLKNAGYFVNASAFACFFVSYPYQPLHLAATVFVGIFLVGLYLHYKKRST